jgi:hypothetical protein
VKALRSLVDPWVERPLLDYAITAAAVSALVAFAPRGLVSRDHWDGLYQTLASVSGILLSLGTVIVTLLFTVTPNERLLRVIAIVGHDLLRLALSSLTMLVLTTVGFLALRASLVAGQQGDAGPGGRDEHIRRQALGEAEISAGRPRRAAPTAAANAGLLSERFRRLA